MVVMGAIAGALQLLEGKGSASTILLLLLSESTTTLSVDNRVVVAADRCGRRTIATRGTKETRTTNADLVMRALTHTDVL